MNLCLIQEWRPMGIFEAIMLMCFGLSWPISIVKSLRTKVVSGKSPLFMAIICIGYLSGIVHKALYALDWVILLYAVNMVMVAVDLTLYYRYAHPHHATVGQGTGS